MAFCKHCLTEVTIALDDASDVCPKCGRSFSAAPEESDDANSRDSDRIEDSDLDSGDLSDLTVDSDQLAPSDTGMGTVRQDEEASDDTDDGEEEDGPASDPEFTHVFGGKYLAGESDDLDDSDDVLALGEAGDDDDEDDDAPPADLADLATLAFESEDEPGARGRRRSLVDAPDLDFDFDVPQDLADAPTQMLGVEPLQQPPPAAGDSSDGASDASSDDPSGTLAAESPDSDRAGSDAASSDAPSSGSGSGTHPEAATIDQHSGTYALDSERQSGRVGTPTPRDISGLSSNRTAPRGPLEGDRGSASIRPGESQSIGSEHVRLKSHVLGDGSLPAGPEVELKGGLDYRFVGGPFAGGMGVVHKAHQATLDRHVAVKQIKSDRAGDQRDREKFVSEAVITGNLEHPNIIPVHDLGLDGEGLPFYSMKFVEGSDWDDQIADLSESENLSILIQVAQAIAFAHSKNIIHMDLKPGNVRLGSFGEVLVMDWGLAARLDTGREVQPGGTPMYMPPELALPFVERWMKPKDGDAEAAERRAARRTPPGTYSDIYLLGALLFKIVTGHAPHRGKSSFEVIKNAARNKIVRTRRQSELLDIAYKAMKTDPAERYRTVTEFIDAVKDYQNHSQSVQIARRASRELKTAEGARKEGAGEIKRAYESYARARHGYENALDLWPENRKAKRRLRKTLRLYAEAAFEGGDYDLALANLDPNSEDDAELRGQVLTSQHRRTRREATYRFLQYGIAGSLAVALVFIAISIVAGRDAISARRKADVAAREATAAQGQAKQARQLADESKQEAEAAERDARIAKDKADEAAALAERESEKAELAAAEAADAVRLAGVERERAATAADEAEKQKGLADVQRQRAREQQYFAALGSVRAALVERGPYAASKLLDRAARDLPDGAENQLEWVRLRRECDWQREATELVGQAAERQARVAASPDGASIVAALASGGATELRIYAVGDDNAARSLRIEGRVDAVALSADARFIATSGADFAIWEAASGRRLRLQTAAGSPVDPTPRAAFAFSPLGDRMIAAGSGTEVETWRLDAATGRAIRESSDDQWHAAPITSVAFSPDGRRRCSADAAGVIRVWTDAGDAAGRWSYRHGDVASGSQSITAVAMTGSGDGFRLAYGCDDGAVYETVVDKPTAAGRLDEEGDLPAEVLWNDARSERLAGVHLMEVTALAYAESDRAIVSAAGDTLWVRPAPAAGSAVRRVWKRVRRYHDEPVTTLAVGGDGVCFSGDAVGRVVRWRVDVAPDAAVFSPPSGEAAAPVAGVRIDPNTRAALVADRAGFVRRWRDGQTKGSEKRFIGHADHRDFRAWSFGGDDPIVVTLAADNRACVWDGRDGTLRRAIDLGEYDVTAVTPRRLLIAATARGARSSAGASPGAVAIPLDGGARLPLWARGPRVGAVQPLDADATRIAVGMRDGQVYLWSRDRGRSALVNSTVRPHWSLISAMAYDARRGELVTGDGAGVVSRWRVAPGEPRLIASRVLDRKAPVDRIAFSPRGRTLIVQRDRRSDEAILSLATDDVFETLASVSLSDDPARDACFDGEAVVALLDDSRIVREQAGRSAPRVEPTRASSGGAAIEGIRVSEDGRLLAFGSGFADLWSGLDSGAELLARVRSRSFARAFGAPTADGEIRLINALGNLDQLGERSSSQASLPLTGEITATCALADASLTVLALRTPGGRTSLEVWDVAAGRRDRVVADFEGVCRAIDASDRFLACGVHGAGAASAVVFDRRSGDAAARIAFDSAAALRSVAVDAAGGQVAAVFADGRAEYALQGDDGRWSVAPLDRRGVTSATFSPDGRRLLVGVESGQVLTLKLEPGAAGPVATRRLLTLAGHSGPVTLLDFAVSGEEVSLVSGDARGRVVVRQF